MSDSTADPIEFQKTFEKVFNGFVTPTVIRDGLISGCVYRADGSKVALSERFGGWKGDLFRSSNQDQLERPDGLQRAGKGLYLGSLMAGHYGHFITEGLSTFWIFETIPATEFDYFLFSPFVFGAKIPEYVLQCFRVFGIDLSKMVIMGDEPLTFEELWVPERLLRLNHSAHPCLKWVYQKIGSIATQPVESGERIYLSRRRMSIRHLTRVISNEVLVEKLFKQAGFTVLYPEELPFEKQVGWYTNVKIVAGPSGSALHNSLFMRTGTKLIELGDPRYGGQRAPTQVICDLVSGVETAFIPFAGSIREESKSVSMDIEVLCKGLNHVLKEFGLLSAKLEVSKICMGPLEFAEVIYLSFRPLLGARWRKLLRMIGIQR